MGCHLAGACPSEVLDISPWAEATARYLLRSPYAQRCPQVQDQLLRLRHDCGKPCSTTSASSRDPPLPDGTTEPGFRVMVAGGLGANPPPRRRSKSSRAARPAPHRRSDLRTFDHYGNRDNKLRARMKWLVDTMGNRGGAHPDHKERRLLRAASGWPGGIPAQVVEHGDAPAGMTVDGVVENLPGSVRCSCAPPTPTSGGCRPTSCAARQRTVSAMASCTLGDITSAQFRALAAIQRDFAIDIRITKPPEPCAPRISPRPTARSYDRLTDIGMADRERGSPATWSLPRADTVTSP